MSTTLRSFERRLPAAGAALLATLLFSASSAAQVPPAPPAPLAPRAPLAPPAPLAPLAPPSTMADVATYEGVVHLYLVNEFGDVEGVIAKDGTQVRFPPHMAADLVRTLKPGDSFVARGNGESGRGFRAYSLGRPGATPLVEARPSGPPTPPVPREARAASLSPMQVDGTVATVLHAPRGEIDGVVMTDGTIVRLPPRSPALDSASLRTGARFSAKGYGTRNDYGRSLRAEMVGVDGRALIALQPEGPAMPRPAGRPGSEARPVPPAPPLDGAAPPVPPTPPTPR